MTSVLNLFQTALELGLISSLTVLALFLSYSMLNICDLSTDGSSLSEHASGAWSLCRDIHFWLSRLPCLRECSPGSSPPFCRPGWG